MDTTQAPRCESIAVRWLTRVSDGGLFAVLFVAPLAMGGRFPVGRFLLSAFVSLTAVSWFAARCLSRRNKSTWGWTGAEWVASLAILLVTLQLLPLPGAVLNWLAPETPSLLPLHSESPTLVGAITGQTPSHWNRISLAPHATRSGLAMACTYALFFFVLVQRLRSLEDTKRTLRWMAGSGILMAGLALAQYLFGNGKFLWLIEHPSRDTLVAAKGTFVNENHFAHFLALTLGPLLWWVVDAHPRPDDDQRSFGATPTPTRVRQYSLFAGLGLVLLAGLLSFSRGGLVMMGLAGAVTVGLLVAKGLIGKRSVVGLAGVSLVITAAVWIHGRESLTRELDTLTSGTIESLDKGQSRRKIWAAVGRAIPDFAIAGSGIGSHRYVYPTYLSEPSQVQYTHAESGYLQILLEAGGPGLGLLLCGMGLGAYWLLRPLVRSFHDEAGSIAVPLMASFTVSAVHALVDFNWHIPANMVLVLAMLACAAQLGMPERRTAGRRRHTPRALWGAVTCLTVLMASLSLTQLWPPARASLYWHEFRAWTLATKRFAAKSIGPGRQRHLGLVDPSRVETGHHMIRLLRDTLERDSEDGRAHVRMAALCLRQFELLQAQSESAMSLAQIRDAALQSEFASHAEMRRWVERVVGDRLVYLQRARWHAGQGVRLTPTEGNAYVYLAEVAFLEEALQGQEHVLLLQAYAARPFHPSVQFVLGHQLLLAGKADAAMTLWKDAFRRAPVVRRRIISAIARDTPPDQLLAVFQPDLEGLQDVFDFYRSQQLEESMRFVGARLVDALETRAALMAGEAAASLWFDAQFTHSVLGNVDRAAEAARNAVRAEPGEYRNHFACALRMREAGRLEEAVRELRWCQARDPSGADLSQAIRSVETDLRRAAAKADGDPPHRVSQVIDEGATR